MQYKPLGHTGLRVSAIAMGCWAIVGGFNWGHQEESDSLAALRAAYDLGITLFDSAEAYGEGRSEQLIARALGDVRDNIVIATKVSPSHFVPAELRAACERSLRNLGTSYIDLYQLHWPNWDIPVAETLGVLDDLRAEGKIRAYGVSNFGRRDLGDCLATPYRVCSNQLAYNLLARGIEHDILPLCAGAEIAVLCYSPLMQGLLTGKFASAADVPEDRARTRHFSRLRRHTRHGQDGAEAATFAAIAEVKRIAGDIGAPMEDVSLAWLLAQPGVTSVIAGARNAEQVRRNAQAAELALAPDSVARLSAATDALKIELGPAADLWAGESRIR